VVESATWWSAVVTTSWHQRFEALVDVGGALLEEVAAPIRHEALGRGIALGVVATGDRLAGAEPLHGVVDGSPLVVAASDGPHRAVVDDGVVTPWPAPAPAPAQAVAGALVEARALVVADLRGIGLAVDPVLGPGTHTQRVALAAGGDHVRHQLARAGISGSASLVDRVTRVARQAVEDVRVRFDGRTIVLAAMDEVDGVRWVLSALAERGIDPGSVLVIDGVGQQRDLLALAHAPGGPMVVAAAEVGSVPELVAAQLRLREDRALPLVTPAPGWWLHLDGYDPERERARATLFSLADGRVGIGGTDVADGQDGGTWTLVAGVYDGDGPQTHLLPAPVSTHLPHDVGGTTDVRRTLDLHAGVLYERVLGDHGRVDTVRFTSLRQPGTVVVRARCSDRPTAPPLLAPAGAAADEGVDEDVRWVAVSGTEGGITSAVEQVVVPPGCCTVVDRVAVHLGDPHCPPDPSTAVAAVRGAADRGFDRLLADHRAAWASRWQDADVQIDGDPELQRDLRFALFHLIGSVADQDEAAVGARGLAGAAYRGHVFWDADTFVLPFLAATHPPAARAMLEYRIRRLDVAKEVARALGRRGARFPWESARSGRDVTPTSVKDRTGKVVPIRTGQLEDHIVAEVAWAACCYVDWTGDAEFERGPGRQVLVETARYWASRVRFDGEGFAHIYGVVGPDEYHEPVDDSAFTNVLARFNLRRAADVAEAIEGDDVGPGEVAEWRRVADALIDGYQPSTGIYEQCAGFFDLEPLIIAEVAPRRPITADLFLGRERVRGAQVIKQADVVMLHHLVPDEVVPESLEPNLRYYEPRTAHGSSLSPAVHAGLFARVRDFERALDALRIAARVDLDDLTLTTATGLHVATMGGLWQAVAMGFAGLRPHGDRLRVDPRLPPSWSGLAIRVRFRGSRVRVQVEHELLRIQSETPITVEVDGVAHAVDAGGLDLRRRGPRWEVVP